MEVVVAAETVLLVLLLVLVAGLLRSHAEILRRLGPAADGDRPLSVIPPRPGRGVGPARDVAGTTPGGDAVGLGLSAGGRPTLLAFLTSGCDTCLGFWDALHGRPREQLPEGVEVVAVAKGPEEESPARLADLAPRVPVVMSSEAWADYAVPGAPYFVYVDAAGRVGGEGVATEWPQLMAMLRDALADTGGTAGERRGADVDRALEAAGIRPGDPSLYPDS